MSGREAAGLDTGTGTDSAVGAVSAADIGIAADINAAVEINGAAEISGAADVTTGVDVPRVPTSAGAWGTGSAQALQDSTADMLIGGDLGDLGPFGDLGTADEPSEVDDPGAAQRAGGRGAQAATAAASATSAAAEYRIDGGRPRAERGRDAYAPEAWSADAERGPDADADAYAPETWSAGAAPGPDARAPEVLAGGSGRAREARAPGAGAIARSGPSRSPQRRTGVDPVKALMHRHRTLCERAVDPLEIAAGLEAHGVTDRAAARFRHKDVFSLAEELYARVPRDGERTEASASAPAPALPPLSTTGVRGAWALFALLPGAVCALTLLAVHVTAGGTRWSVVVCGTLAGAAALHTALRRGPLRADGPPAPTTRLWTGWLLAYALFGDGLLDAALTGGPDEVWAPATAPLLALAVAVAPAAWCARLYTAGAHRRLATSRGLAEFAASARPLLLGIVILFASALAALLGLAGALIGQRVDYAGAGALGLLLLLTRLLVAHGRTHAPAVVLGAATAVEVLAVASVFAARLPACDVLSTPVEAGVTALGAGIVPTTACGAAALVLLVHAIRTLARASAHTRAQGATGGAP